MTKSHPFSAIATNPGRARSGRRSARLASGIATGLVLMAATIPADDLVAREESEPAAAVTGTAQHPRQNTFMKRQWGVEILYVRNTAAGYMLELRYKVLDPDKARPLFDRQAKPLLTHVESGATFVVPSPAKTGALRNSNAPLAGHTYWMFFANPGKRVQPGQHVNVAIGEFRADGLVVE